jgi:hypothetical protein
MAEVTAAADQRSRGMEQINTAIEELHQVR